RPSFPARRSSDLTADLPILAWVCPAGRAVLGLPSRVGRCGLPGRTGLLGLSGSVRLRGQIGSLGRRTVEDPRLRERPETSVLPPTGTGTCQRAPQGAMATAG